jgi:hypothetical protein
MHKKAVQNVGHKMFNAMEKRPLKNSGFIVWSVIEHLSGNYRKTVHYDVDIGSSYGLQKAAPSAFYARYPVTVLQSLIRLENTGLAKYQRSRSTIPGYSMWYMMGPIFTRMAVC